MRPVDVQTPLFQQPLGGNERVEGLEYPPQENGIVYEAVDGPALTRDERTGRQAEAKRGYDLVDACFALARMRADDPERIRMLLQSALFESHHGYRLSFRVHLRGAEPEAHPLLVHEVQEVGLGVSPSR